MPVLMKRLSKIIIDHSAINVKHAKSVWKMLDLCGVLNFPNLKKSGKMIKHSFTVHNPATDKQKYYYPV